MKVLVTGTGFVGSHLCDELLRRGHEVKVLIHYDDRKIAHIKDQVEIDRGDIRYMDECLEAVEGVDAVAHLAAVIHVDRSRRFPQLFWETNVQGTMNMLEAARRSDTKFLQMSTCEVLGHIPSGKAAEDFSFKQPRSPYAASKYAAEAYCHSYAYTYNLPVNIARCFNICGPRQKYGGKGAVIPIFINKVLHNQPPTIYGTGEQTRDFTDVRDIVKGLAFLLESDYRGELFHLCSGVERSINDLARLVLNACDSPLEPIHILDRPGELIRSVGDYSKAKKLLNWEPTIAFDQTMKDTVSYYREWI